MSENIIYCYSGSGHCLNMAREIAKVLGDTDIVLMRSAPVKTDATEAKRVGFVFPCFGGGLPGDVENYVKSIRIAPGAYKFAVEQYAPVHPALITAFFCSSSRGARAGGA